MPVKLELGKEKSEMRDRALTTMHQTKGQIR